MANNNNNFKFEIVKEIAALSTNGAGWSKELNLVSWNGRAPVYYLRAWDPEHKRMGKGIALTESELRELAAVIEDEFK